MPLVSQVPLAGKECLVAVGLKCFSNRHFLKRQIVSVLRMKQSIRLVILLAWNPVRDIHSDRMTAGQDAGPRGRADRAGGIAIGQPHATGGQLINMGSLVKCTAIATEICPAEIIDEEEDKVGLVCCPGLAG